VVSTESSDHYGSAIVDQDKFGEGPPTSISDGLGTGRRRERCSAHVHYSFMARAELKVTTARREILTDGRHHADEGSWLVLRDLARG